MNTHFRHTAIALLLAICLGHSECAEAQTPASNLAGIKQFNDRIDVGLNLVGADEFGLDPNEVAKIVRAALASAHISLAKGDYKTPTVKLHISGESSGGGGNYTVEITVTALLPSPFAKDRSIQAILWRESASASHHLRIDPAAKEIIKPSGPIKERVYDSVREVALRLASALKAA